MSSELRDKLTLEPLGGDLFRGENFGNVAAPGRIFGGQVIAQSLMAAYGTIEDKVCHSLHAYFLREGDLDRPVTFRVERVRDGRGFASRRVTAAQGDREIFQLAASFQQAEDGFDG